MIGHGIPYDSGKWTFGSTFFFFWAHYKLALVSLSILLETFEPLEQSVSKGFPVAWTQCVQKRVNRLMVLSVQILIHFVKSIAHHLFGQGEERKKNKYKSLGHNLIKI